MVERYALGVEFSLFWINAIGLTAYLLLAGFYSRRLREPMVLGFFVFFPLHFLRFVFFSAGDSSRLVEFFGKFSFLWYDPYRPIIARGTEVAGAAILLFCLLISYMNGRRHGK